MGDRWDGQRSPSKSRSRERQRGDRGGERSPRDRRRPSRSPEERRRQSRERRRRSRSRSRSRSRGRYGRGAGIHRSDRKLGGGTWGCFCHKLSFCVAELFSRQSAEQHRAPCHARCCYQPADSRRERSPAPRRNRSPPSRGHGSRSPPGRGGYGGRRGASRSPPPREQQRNRWEPPRPDMHPPPRMPVSGAVKTEASRHCRRPLPQSSTGLAPGRSSRWLRFGWRFGAAVLPANGPHYTPPPTPAAPHTVTTCPPACRRASRGGHHPPRPCRVGAPLWRLCGAARLPQAGADTPHPGGGGRVGWTGLCRTRTLPASLPLPVHAQTFESAWADLVVSIGSTDENRRPGCLLLPPVMLDPDAACCHRCPACQVSDEIQFGREEDDEMKVKGARGSCCTISRREGEICMCRGWSA